MQTPMLPVNQARKAASPSAFQVKKNGAARADRRERPQSRPQPANPARAEMDRPTPRYGPRYWPVH